MLLSVNSGFSLSTVHADRDGRYIIAKVSIGDEYLFVINIYAPNKDAEQELFIRSLGANLSDLSLFSDLENEDNYSRRMQNGSLFAKDKFGGLRWRETNFRNFISDIIEELDLADINRKLQWSSINFNNSLNVNDIFLGVQDLNGPEYRAQERDKISINLMQET